MRSTFACGACKFDAPLNHFELVDAVACTRCGHEQRYDLAEWKRLVEYFDAPSKQRKKLVNEAKQTSKRDRKVASERAMAQHVANRDDASALAAKQRIFGNEPTHPPEGGGGESMGLALVVLLLLAAGGGAVVWFLVLSK